MAARWAALAPCTKAALCPSVLASSGRLLAVKLIRQLLVAASHAPSASASCSSVSSGAAAARPASPPSTSGRGPPDLLLCLHATTQHGLLAAPQHRTHLLSPPPPHWYWRLPAPARHLLARRPFASKAKLEYVPLRTPVVDSYASSMPTNPLQLLNAIAKAPDLARLEELTEASWLPRYDAVHAAAALTRLPKLVRYRDKDMVATGAVAPAGSGVRPARPAPGAAPRQASGERATALARRLMALLPGLAPRMFPRQAANCVWALGTLHAMGLPVVEPINWRDSPDAMQETRLALLGGGGGGSAAADSGGLPAKGKQAPGHGVSVEELAADLKLKMGACFSDAYASLLTVVARDGYAPLQRHAQPAEVAQLLKGMSQLPRGCQHFESVHALAAWLARNAGAHSMRARELGMALRSLAALHDARAARALGGSGGEAVGAALVAAAPRCVALQRDFAPSGIANVMWAYAACRASGPLQLVPDETVRELYAALTTGIQPQIVLVNAQDIAMITWACAKQGYRDAALLELLGDKAVQLLSSFKPKELAQTLKAMADLQLPHARLLAAMVRGVLSEPTIDPNLGLGVVSKVTHAFVSGGLDAVSELGDGTEAAAGARQQALEMLRRLRATVAPGLAGGSWGLPTAEEVALMAEGLVRVLKEEARVAAEGGGNGKAAAAKGAAVGAVPIGMGGGSEDDEALISELAAAAEQLFKACSLAELASLLTSLEGLKFGLELGNLEAAARARAKVLLEQLWKELGAAVVRRRPLTERELQQACDVLRVVALTWGANDPEVGQSVGALLAHAAGGAHQGGGTAAKLPPSTLVQTLVGCHRMNSAKPEVRGAVGSLLASASSAGDKGLAGVEAEGLAAAFGAYAEYAEAGLRQATAAAAAANKRAAEGRGAEAETAAPSAGAMRVLDGDLAAMEVLAAALAPRVGELGREERRALSAAVGRVVAAAGRSGTDEAEGGAGELIRALKRFEER